MSNRVFFSITSGWGPVMRVLPIAHLLKEKGCEVFFRAAGPIAEKLEQFGFVVKAPEAPRGVIMRPTPRKWWTLDHFLALHGWKSEEYVEQRYLAHRRMVEDCQPDLIVGDISPDASMVANTLNLPYVSIAQSLFLPFRKRKNILWWEDPPKRLPDISPTINMVLKKYNGQEIESTEDLIVGIRTLIPSFPEFDPLESTPHGVLYIGPIVTEELEENEGGSLPQTDCVFVYPGRPKDSGHSTGELILKFVLPVLRKLELTSVVSTGSFAYSDEVVKMQATNLLFHNWVPMSFVREHGTVFIHHGGHGTCLASVQLGLPSLVIPTFAERAYNAENLSALGCAKVIHLSQLTQRAVRESIEELTNNRCYSEKAKHWQAELERRRYGGAQVAADAIALVLRDNV
ncbi:hypothetical protein CO157_05345 [Candidatus Peregrinibacteria bacterium CG_4_9_14_3_um_filter_49_12]|uniref:Erythromycin biosynthesis protein CIII-like C-terminal domain-containing protein n=1 Tax=Candidatus Zambryskibacteria bacterium CG22_combo_CG10-13_8_21_14_all_42_17 TaxID=1975118 RepID=A0A2H0BCR4_9BACT|nr:MAG: hypothetical protein COX06_03085 [Candidatus Zambryskibacteria bacterium CG22_combo_CG10-13_8_21_14_all_42_17]PJA67300.1 MAG: hypothetical protein CO157_05345 [Candidatus Peregrinibacteria bacterium CG_4_9_14_3_um_filter_49_12]